VRIAVDVLGGDHAPHEMLLGVIDALKYDFTADQLILVGPKEVIEATLAEHGVDVPEIIQTDVVVEAGEKPVEAMRRKPQASVFLCAKAVKEGKAAGTISFGNTGAAVAAATLGLGMLPGVKRPGIAIPLNNAKSKTVLLDAGANPTPKAEHLFQYAAMGTAYARDIHKIENPRIGLLNIGGEANKGHGLVQEAHQLLSDSNLNFIGNVEGQDLFSGNAEVLITDGFVGNMILKVVEGFIGYLVDGVESASAHADSAETSSAIRDTFRRLVGVADYSEAGGAALLGVNGVVLIGHGRSTANAVPPALRAARAEIEAGLNNDITSLLGNANRPKSTEA